MIILPPSATPKKMQHKKLDSELNSALGIVIPYKCTWHDDGSLNTIEYFVDEEAPFKAKDVEEVFKSHVLEDGEPDEMELLKENREKAERERADFQKLRGLVHEQNARLDSIESLIRTLISKK